MGYAVIIFGVLLAASVVIAMVVTYGVVKDSQVAPLKAKNIYAEREAGKAQTRLTIVNTCLVGSYPYNYRSGGTGPYILWLTVRNNGSTVLNPNNSTIFYNLSYYKFSVTTDMGSYNPFGDVWSPLTNASMSVPDIYIPDLNYPYRLMMAASNGIATIAPTAPTNFSGTSIKANTSFSFSWAPSTDNTGIAYYILNDLADRPGGNYCPPSINATLIVPGNSTTTSMSQDYACPGGSCSNNYFWLNAVDTEGNMGIQSVTLKCAPASDKDCVTETIK